MGKIKEGKKRQFKMNSFEYIFSKQVSWAQNKGIDLVGSKGSRGHPASMKMLKENLIIPTEKTERDY